jgi:hypothetical protein
VGLIVGGWWWVFGSVRYEEDGGCLQKQREGGIYGRNSSLLWASCCCLWASSSSRKNGGEEKRHEQRGGIGERVCYFWRKALQQRETAAGSSGARGEYSQQQAAVNISKPIPFEAIRGPDRDISALGGEALEY